MKPKSNQSRQSEFKTRQRKAGLIQIAVWIPKDRKADVLAYVKNGGWISVEDRLPELDQWVNVLQNVGGYSEIDEHGEPIYWFESDYYMYLTLKREMISVTSATLRYIEEGWGYWQQGEIASGHALVDIKHVTHWMPLPEAYVESVKGDNK